MRGVHFKFFDAFKYEIDEDEFSYLIAQLCVYYKGSVSLEYFETMPFLKVLDLNRYAAKMNESAEREAKKRG